MKTSIIFLIVILFGFLGLAFMHEQVHVAIFDSYDIESEIHLISDFPDMTTIVSEEDYNNKCNDNCKLAHNINEAITYPLIIFYFLISLGLLCLIVKMEVKQNE